MLFFTQKRRASGAVAALPSPVPSSTAPADPVSSPRAVSTGGFLPQPGQTKPRRPGRHSPAAELGPPRAYPCLVQRDAGATASPGLGGGAAGSAGLGGAGPRGDEMAAASGRPRLCSGPRPRPGPRRLGPEKAQRALPGVHHGPARRTASTPRPGEPSKAGPPAGQSGPVEPGQESRARPDSAERRRGQVRVGQRKGSRRAKAGGGRWEQCPRPTAQTLRRLRLPQREPSGAAISTPFSLVLALELRASGIQRCRADETASSRGHCRALQGRPALPLPAAPSSPPTPPAGPAQRRGVSAPRPKGRSGLCQLYGFQVWPALQEGGWEIPEGARDEP